MFFVLKWLFGCDMCCVCWVVVVVVGCDDCLLFCLVFYDDVSFWCICVCLICCDFVLEWIVCWCIIVCGVVVWCVSGGCCGVVCCGCLCVWFELFGGCRSFVVVCDWCDVGVWVFLWWFLCVVDVVGLFVWCWSDFVLVVCLCCVVVCVVLLLVW